MTTRYAIRKDTWHYRVWKFTYFFRGGQIGEYPNLPMQTNLCRYVSRTIFYPIPIALAVVALVCTAVGIVVIFNAFTILSGTGVFGGFVGNDDIPPASDEYKMMWFFPHISVGTWQLPMYAFVLPLYVLLIAAVVVYMHPSTSLVYAGYGMAGLCALVLLCGIGAIIVDGCRRVRRWEGWMLFRAYLKAKKEGVCPLITFDEPDHPAPTEVGEPETA
jgi:hypothetical protein